MPNTAEYSVKTNTKKYPGGSVNTVTRDDIKRLTRTVSSITGNWLTFPDGSRFRLATPYGKSSTWIGPNAPEFTEWSSVFNPSDTGFVETSAGGYRGDLIFSNMAHTVCAPLVPDLQDFPPLNASMRNECETKALLDLADAKAGIGENLATLGQIIRLVKDPLGSLIKEFKKVREKKSLWSLAHRSARSFTSGELGTSAVKEYLKYVYGWKPLVQDIYGIMELAKQAGNRPLLIHSEGTSKREEHLRDVSHYAVSYDLVTDTFDTTAISRAKCHLWAQPDPDWAGARTLNQLGLLNPVSLLWELVPASFVIDWALPIGPVLQALTAPAGLTFVNGSTSQRVSARWAYEQRNVVGSNLVITSQKPSSGFGAYEGYSRVPLGSWPRPGFWFDPDPLRLKSDDSDRVFKFLALALLSVK